MSPQPSVDSHAPSLLWTGFKSLVLVVGCAIAFMPDDLRPIAWRLATTLVQGEVAMGLGVSLGALLACFVAIALVGHLLMPDEPEPR